MIRPNGPRLLVQRLPEPKPVSSMIAMPDTIMEKPSKFAIVLAVGKLLDPCIEVGDMILIKDFAGAPVTTQFADEVIEAFIIMETDILGIITEGEQ